MSKQFLNLQDMESRARQKILVAVAGGSGTRMGTEIPKQFLEIGGKAILRLSIEKFIAAVPGIKVITVLPEAHVPRWKEYCIRTSFICPQTIVKGGLTRFHSVKNALGTIPDGALVAIHDGVRPLLSCDMVARMFEAAETEPAVIPVLPCVDTMKALRKNPESGKLEPVDGMNVDRSLLYAVQTPQIFHSEILKEAYSQPYDTAFTDDASVVAKKGMPLTYVEGERLNIKITAKDDLRLAEAILTV